MVFVLLLLLEKNTLCMKDIRICSSPTFKWTEVRTTVMIKRSFKDQGQKALIIINPTLISGLLPNLEIENKIFVFFVLLTPRLFVQMNHHVPLPDQDAAPKAFGSFPNALVWEEDMQMSSNFLDRKVNSNI